MRLVLVILLCGAATASAAPEASIEVVAAPPIATAPEAGLDPDVSARLDAAERAIATSSPAELDELLDRVLVLFESDDPFSLAQRDAAKPRTIAILGKLGERARASGDLVLAARALDARWTIGGGRRDPQLAEVLATWAERDAAAAPAQSLYLARRARKADPDQRKARDLDDDLSRNHRAWSGRLMIVAGFAALAAGIYARTRVGAIESDLAMQARPGDEVDRQLAARDRYDMIGTGLLVAAPVLSIGGIVFLASGNPSYTPTSPNELPALGDP
ncbi:MAG TPA: hypothetical protein VIV11_38875 [Kofleriaceae bacterium]